MLKNALVILVLGFFITSCANKNHNEESKNESSTQEIEDNSSISTIAFASCGHQNEPQPILSQIAKTDPDLFIFLGDNIYGDTYSMDTLEMKYAMLAAKPEFQELKEATTILATWDDHDFGWNDSGRHYPYKEASKEIFLDFFDEPQESERRTRDGIYTSYYFGEEGRKAQIIVLDTRTFRDDLVKYNGNKAGDTAFHYQLDYSPNDNQDSTLLGEKQWEWLEEELLKPADLRIIASSTQFGITHNGYEAWANVPHEQQKMLDLIKKTKAEGVLFISGDVHYAEISKLEEKNLYPIYDVTSSGITSTWHFATPNDNRIEGPVMENHFGLLTINWENSIPTVKAEIFDVSGNRRISKVISLSELSY